MAEFLNKNKSILTVAQKLAKGGYYKPTVDSEGNLSWTQSETSMPDVETVNIKGPSGESPTATITENDQGALITITSASGTTTAQIYNGEDGDISFAQADKEELVQMVLDSLYKAEEVGF